MIPHIWSVQHFDWGSILTGLGFRDAHGVRYNDGLDKYLTLEGTKTAKIYSKIRSLFNKITVY